MPPPSPPKRVDDAADRLRHDILIGTFAAGTDLPGERDLSLRLGVSRLTLRAAIARLQAEGLVQPVHGSGNRVLDFRESGGVELLGHLAAIAQAGGSFPLELLSNLLELRRVVAIDAVALAAERCTDAELAALRENVEAQAAVTEDAQQYIAVDLNFARLLARATHNIALSLLANTIVRVLERQPGIELTFVLDPHAAVDVYRRMVAAIARRDGKAARTLTRKLLEAFDRALLAKIEAVTGGRQKSRAKRSA